MISVVLKQSQNSPISNFSRPVAFCLWCRAISIMTVLFLLNYAEYEPCVHSILAKKVLHVLTNTSNCRPHASVKRHESATDLPPRISVLHLFPYRSLLQKMYTGNLNTVQCVSIKVHAFYFSDNFFYCKSIQIILGSNIAEKIWNKLTRGNFDMRC